MNHPVPDRLSDDFPFADHNQEMRSAWDAYHRGAPYRVPVIVGTNTRFFMFNANANPEGMDFERYTEDPNLMFDVALRYQRWSRFNLLQDAELGLPERWWIGIDFQNYYESAWFGCKVHYIPGEVPDTRPDFFDSPERVMENGLPGPFSGIMSRAIEYYEAMKARAQKEAFLDRPIEVGAPGCGMGSDGPMTVACNLFGPEFVCTAMAEEPDRMRELFTFITDATLQRMMAFRKKYGVPVPQDGFGMADDSIALISTAMYREQILPHHRRLYNTLGNDTPRSIHLCGNSTRHFLTLRDELNIRTFDTGFPVDFGQLRQSLGPDVRIQGGPHVELLRSATPEQVREEVRRILATGVLEGGMFVLREGNNLAPGTPLENIEAMVHAGREFGMLN